MGGHHEAALRVRPVRALCQPSSVSDRPWGRMAAGTFRLLARRCRDECVPPVARTRFEHIQRDRSRERLRIRGMQARHLPRHCGRAYRFEGFLRVSAYQRLVGFQSLTDNSGRAVTVGDDEALLPPRQSPRHGIIHIAPEERPGGAMRLAQCRPRRCELREPGKARALFGEQCRPPPPRCPVRQDRQPRRPPPPMRGREVLGKTICPRRAAAQEAPPPPPPAPQGRGRRAPRRAPLSPPRPIAPARRQRRRGRRSRHRAPPSSNAPARSGGGAARSPAATPPRGARQ